MGNEASDFLFGGGSKAAKFEQMGDTVTGKIDAARVEQQTSMDDNAPLTWPDGSPRMQLVITLLTDQRDPDNDNDDGSRRVFAKGGQYEVAEGTGKSMKEAIADAVRRAGAKEIDEGATLTVAFTGKGKATNRGYAQPKLFKAKYEPPSKSVQVDDLFDD